MESSRIFVRNLPPSITEDKFRAHFALYPITDVRLIAKRRIGFVGFKTPDEASKAVKHYDRSFVGLSKISVQIATPVERIPRHAKDDASKKSEPTAETQKSLKRKRDVDERPKDPKLDEFLRVMKATAKSQVWKDDAIGDTADADVEVDAGDSSEDDMQVIGGSFPKHSVAKVDRDSPVPPNQPSHVPQTDDDWLRSKTSKHLDDKAERGDAPEAMDLDDAQHSKQQSDKPPETDPQPENMTEEEKIIKYRRLYVRNLPFDVAEDHLRAHFAIFGELEEVHVPVTTTSRQSKGFAFLLFVNSDDALRAYREMDGATYQGRLLHILPAQPKRENISQLDEHAISKLQLKQQLKIKRKMESNTAAFKWNALYMNTDDVMSSIAARMGVEKSELLDPTSSDAAVKQALAETHVIQEAKSYFCENGVDLDSFKPGRKRSDTAILVKNFPHGTKHDEIKDRFSSHGQIVRLLIPPSGTMALVEFAAPSHGRAAFDALKYSRVGSSILFLEKAPEDVFSSAPRTTAAATLAAFAPHDDSKQAKLTTADLLEGTPNVENVDTSTLFVRNLNFTTTNDKLRDAFSPLSGFLSAKVKTKPDPKRSGQTLSMGFGFIEFRSKEDAKAALAAMSGYSLEGYKLDVRPSQKTLDEGAARRKQDRAKAATMHQTKVVVKNLPFEATKKDVRTLLGSYGQLRSVRVPRKFDNSTRGFAFAEFTTPLEASNAMAALKNTHLLGRRLHIDYATVDAVDAEEEIERMQKKVGAQVDKLSLQKLVGPGRKKFVLPGNELDDG